MDTKHVTKQIKQIRSATELDKYVADIDLELDDVITTIGTLMGITDETVSDQFATHGPRLAYIGMLSATAKTAYLRAKHRSKVVYAEEYSMIRMELEGKVRVTEKMVDNAVLEESNRYADAKSEEFLAGEYAELLDALSKAMYQRGELLRSIGADKRQELTQQDVVMARQRLSYIKTDSEDKDD